MLYHTCCITVPSSLKELGSYELALILLLDLKFVVGVVSVVLHISNAFIIVDLMSMCLLSVLWLCRKYLVNEST